MHKDITPNHKPNVFENFDSLKKSINNLAENYELTCLKIVDLGEVEDDEDYEDDNRLSM